MLTVNGHIIDNACIRGQRRNGVFWVGKALILHAFECDKHIPLKSSTLRSINKHMRKSYTGAFNERHTKCTRKHKMTKAPSA
eukprot:773263-Amphidinium_carterae.1